jgi:uncharacterized protein (DUF433 family)
MLEQEKVNHFYTSYAPEVIISEIDVLTASITQTDFPYIEIRNSAESPSTFIRGTRVMVGTIIGYLLMGETPNSIVKEILPHLTLAQVRDAIRYYSVYKAQIDKERSENTEEAARKYLREKLGEENYRKITGANGG